MTVPEKAGLRIISLVGPGEARAIEAAARALAPFVKPGGPSLLAVQPLTWSDWPQAMPAGALAIASMSVHLHEDVGDLQSVKKRWRDQIETFRGEGCVEIFLMTIFPYISKSERAADPEGALRHVEKIRRLNMLAIELSHETGVSIIDIGRWFSAIGANLLKTDYRLGGPQAQWAAAEFTVATVLEAGLDPYFDAPPQVNGAARLGRTLGRLTAPEAQVP